MFKTLFKETSPMLASAKLLLSLKYSVLRGFAILGFIWALTLEVQAMVFVDPFAYGANNGTDWFHAYNSLKEAVEKSPPGSIFYVAEGMHYATPMNDPDETDVIKLKPGMELYGGFRGWSLKRKDRDGTLRKWERNWKERPTIIEGRFPEAVRKDPNIRSRTLIVAAEDCVIDGFVLRNAGARCDAECSGGHKGAAIIAGDIGEGTIIVANCVFEGNSACAGPAIYIEKGTLKINDCVLTNNASCLSGSDVFVPEKDVADEAVRVDESEVVEAAVGKSAGVEVKIWSGGKWIDSPPSEDQVVLLEDGVFELDFATPRFWHVTIGENATLKLLGSKAVVNARGMLVKGKIEHVPDSEVYGPEINLTGDLDISGGKVSAQNVSIVCGGSVILDVQPLIWKLERIPALGSNAEETSYWQTMPL